MDAGATSLYGFIFQVYLSLVALMYGSVDVLQVVRTTLSPSVAEAAVRGEDISSDSPLDILVAMEGNSDVDLHRPGNGDGNPTVEFIQVKSRPRSRRKWTITELFTEVLQKFPLRSLVSPVGDRKILRFTLALDTGLNGHIEVFLRFCNWLERKPGDSSWESWLAGGEGGDQLVAFPASNLWGDLALRCAFRELPAKIHQFGALYQRSRQVEEVNEASGLVIVSDADPLLAPEDEDPSSYLSINKICELLSAFRIITRIGFEDLQIRVQEDLRHYLPIENVEAAEARLFRHAVRFASETPGRLVTRRAFMAALGIPPRPFAFETIRAASQHVLGKRLHLNQNEPAVTARREDAERSFQTFMLLGSVKVFVLAGPARIGKSRQLREWARELVAEHPVYFDTARDLDIDRTAHELCRALGHEGQDTHLSFGSLVLRSQVGLSDGVARPFLLLIDAIDEVDDLDALRRRLRPIFEELGALPIKIVISCKSFAWDEARSLLESVRQWIWQPATPRIENSDEETNSEAPMVSVPRDSDKLPSPLAPTFTMKPFTPLERDDALSANGLRLEATYSDEVLQKALQDPGYFTIYSLLPHDVNDEDASNWYPVRLIKQFWVKQAQKWSQIVHRRPDALEQVLLRIAEFILDEAGADMTTELGRLRELGPPGSIDLEVDLEGPQNVYYVAKGLGLLGETLERHPNGDGAAPRVSIQPPYMLEYALMRLMRQSFDKTGGTGADAVAEWLMTLLPKLESETFEPAQYGLAFLIQELCLAGDPRAAGLLTVILKEQIVPIEPFIHIVSDAASEILATEVRIHDEPNARYALSVLQTRRSVRALLGLLDDPDEKVCMQAAHSLIRHPLPEAWVMRRLLEHRDVTHTQTSRALDNAARTLIDAGLSSGSQELLRLTETYLSDDRYHVRVRCSAWLGAVAHRSSIPALRAALPQVWDADRDMFGNISFALATMGDSINVLQPLLTAAKVATIEDRSLFIWSLARLRTPAARDVFVSAVERHTHEKHHTVEWALLGLRRLGDTEISLRLLRPMLLGDGHGAFVGSLTEIKRLRTATGVLILVECLARACEVSNVDEQSLWPIVREIDKIDTVAELQAITNLRQMDPDLWERVEAAAYRLVAEFHSPDVPSRTLSRELHEAGRGVLVSLSSPRLSEAFAISLSNQNPDRFSRESAAKEISLVGTERDLPALQAVERDTRGVHRTVNGMIDPRLMLADECAAAAAAIGGPKAFELYLDFLRNHELFSDGVDAIEYFSKDVFDADALLALAEDTSADEVARLHAVYAAALYSELSSSDLERLLALLRSESTPTDVRAKVIEAIGWHTYVPGIPLLHDILATPNLQRHLKGVCEEALCRLGDERLARELEARLRNAIAMSTNGNSPAVRYLANFPHAHDYRPMVDALLVDIIGATGSATGSSHSNWRYEAMEGIRRRYAEGTSIPGAVESLVNWMQRPHDPGMTLLDDHVGLGVIAAIDPEALCKTAQSLSVENWSSPAQQELIAALEMTGRPDAGEILTRWILSDDISLRRASAFALSRLPEGHAIAQRYLLTLVAQGTILACTVAETLLWFDGEWATELLATLADHDDRRVRRSASTIQDWRRDRAEVAALTEWFRSETSPMVRWACARVIARLGDETTMAYMESVMNSRDERYGIAHALLATQCYESVKKRMEKLEKELERKPIWES